MTSKKTAVKRLKLNKSQDPDCMLAEHFIYADSDILYQYLCDYYNKIFQLGYTPPTLSKSTIIPLVKSYKKSLSDANNYCDISLIPILTKILELLILSTCPTLKNLNKSQFGFTEETSTLHAAFTIKETINNYNKLNSAVYICSLDAEKAFDSCNWEILFNKLKEKSIPLNIIKILTSLYQNGTVSVVSWSYTMENNHTASA